MKKRKKRRHLLIFQKDDSAAGTNIPDWQDDFKEWGRIEQSGGQQNFRHDEVNETGKVTIKTLKREGMTTKHRIKFVDKSYSGAGTNRFFTIIDISDDLQGGRPEVFIKCEEDENG